MQAIKTIDNPMWMPDEYLLRQTMELHSQVCHPDYIMNKQVHEKFASCRSEIARRMNMVPDCLRDYPRKDEQ